MSVLNLTNHTSGYSFISSILLNTIVRKGNIIGSANFNISLVMELWPLALLFFNYFIQFETSFAVNGESNTGSPALMCLKVEISPQVFSKWKSLGKCSTQLLVEIALIRVSEVIITFSNFRCDQNCQLSVKDSSLAKQLPNSFF